MNKQQVAARPTLVLALFATLCAPGVFAQTPGLVAALSFDEGTGTNAADSSGNNNRGTLVNGATWSTTAKFGNAASFDGTNDRIDVADSNSLDLTSGMTLEAWVRPTASSGYRTVLLKEVSGELAYSIYAADSDHSTRPSGWIRVANTSRYADGTGALPLNTYSHVAVTYNGSSLVFYVNGVATRTTAVTGNIQTSTMSLRIGGNTIWGEYFQGQIDEVRVYNRALTQSEIQTDMVTPIASGGGQQDTTAPSVSVIAPAEGATVSGTVTISADAADNVGIVGVQFKLDGANVGSEDTTSPYSTSWNTLSAGSGNHQLTAVARDAAGNITTSAATTVNVSNVDSQAPTVSLTAPANGATVAGTVSVSADAADNVGVTGVQFKLDGANLGAEDLSSPYSIAWATTGASEGSHELTATARDAAGNSTTSTVRTVTVSNTDAQAPTVSLTAPANGATVSGTVTVSASASDNLGVTGVQFKLDGTNLGAEDLSSPYSISWSTTGTSDGSHELTATARDAAGNTTTSSVRTVTVGNADTQAPTVSLTAPADGATVSSTVTVSASASDNAGVTGVQFKLDGANLGAEDLTSPYSISWSTTGASNGSHQLSATARDAAGNSTTSVVRTVTVSNSSGDTQAPTVSLSAPANGATVSGTVTLTATATDNVGVVGVQFKVDGVNAGTEDTSSPYSRSWDSRTVADGAHTISAVARDAAGNTTTSSSRTVTVGNVDSQSPTVSLTAPANGATVSGTVTLSASASDNVGVVGVQFRVDGVNSGTEDTSSPYSRSWDSRTATNGTHSITAVARDAAGNTTTSSVRTVTVNNGDSQAPTVSLSAPANGATVSGTVTLSASASDNLGVVGVQFRVDGVNTGAEDTSSPYSRSWDSRTATNGTHSITAVARDAAGNTTTSTARTVTVSNGGGGGTNLAINGSQQFQTIDGFGISANSLSWNNGELRPAIDQLVNGGSTIWRVVIDMADWEATNDDADPNNFNWAYYDTIYSSGKFEELWATMAYLNEKGVTNLLMLNFMGIGPGWMGGPDLPTAMEEEWVETVASVAYYARNNRHLQFGLFAPNNEPDWDGIEGIRMDRWQYARVMRKLSQRLDAIGLGDLRLVGPDTAAVGSGVNDYLPELMREPTVMSKLDHFAFHNYAGDSGGADAAIKGSAYPSKNFWISEVANIWDALAHVSQGPAGILVWDGYDSVYNHAIYAGRGSNPPNDAGNGPALLSYNTSTRTYSARKPYYEFAQLFKFVPAGSVRVAATESNSNVTLYAFHHAVSGRVTLVGRNAGSSNVTFSGSLSNLPTVPAFEFYTTTTSNNLQRGADVAVTGQAFSFSAPANGVFTLTYAGPADSVAPTVSVTAPDAGATVSGTVTVSSSTASDNVGIRGVQFWLDGELLGVEDVAAPYSVSWNTTGTTNGAHQLVAVARDWQGNVTTSDPVEVNVAN